MPETVKLPAFGPVKKQYVFAGVALVGGILVYAWWKYAGAGATTPPELEPFEPELSPPDLGIGGVSTGGGTSDTGLEFITTNAQWTNAAVAKMVDLGYDAIKVSAALGKFLANQCVVLEEQTWINTALGLQGKPPVGEHSIRLCETTPSPTPTPTPAARLPAPTGLRKVRNAGTGSALIDWNSVAGANWYRVYRDGAPFSLLPVSSMIVPRNHSYAVAAVDSKIIGGKPTQVTGAISASIRV